MCVARVLEAGKIYVLFTPTARMEGRFIRMDGETVVLDAGRRTLRVPAPIVKAVLEPYEKRTAA